MTQIGTIEYKAKVSNVAEAQKDAQDFAESQRDVAAASEEASSSTSFLAGVLATTANREEEAAEDADNFDVSLTLLASTAWFATKALGSFAASALGVSGALATAKSAAITLYGWLSGLTLSGIIGSVTGALSSFVSWLAAGSAGALAVGAAIGAVIGLFGVWILEITGVLDKVQQLGRWLGGKLPAWARDGLQTVIALFTGPLAAIGAFIVGTIRGGFDKGFAMAKRVIKIQVGAIKRTFNRFKNFVFRIGDRAGQFLANGFKWAKRQIMGFIRDIEAKIGQLVRRIKNIPEQAQRAASQVRVGGVGVAKPGTGASKEGAVGVSGFPVNVPFLDKGGIIQETGAAVVHKGEAVVPTDAMGGGSGGGTTVKVDTIRVDLSGDFDPSKMSRRDLESLADDLVDMIGKKANTNAGFR